MNFVSKMMILTQVSGIGVQLIPAKGPVQVPPCQCVHCTGVTSTFSFSKISDMDKREATAEMDCGIDLVVKIKSGTLAKIMVSCDEGAKMMNFALRTRSFV